jgi:DNA-binding beta-propeller fold protein YncE
MSRLIAVILTLVVAASAPAQIVTTDFFSSAIYQYSISGSGLQQTINSPGANGLNGPAGLAIGPDNHIYYSGKGTTATDNAIYRFDTTTNTVSTFITAAQLSAVTGGGPYAPTGLKFGPDGKLYVARSIGQNANPGTGAVDRFTAAGAFDATIAAGLSQPTGLLFNGTDLYVSNLIGANVNGHGDVVRITNSTTIPLVLPFITTGSGALENPTGMAFGPDGNFYIADVSYPGTGTGIRKYTSAGAPVAPNALVIPQFGQFTSDLLFTNGLLLTAGLGFPGFSPGGINAYDATTLAFDHVVASGTGFGSLAFNPIPEPALLGVVLLGGLFVRTRFRNC